MQSGSGSGSRVIKASSCLLWLCEKLSKRYHLAQGQHESSTNSRQTNSLWGENNPLGIVPSTFTSTRAARDSRERGKQMKSKRKLWKCSGERKTHDATMLLFGVSEVTAPDLGKCCFGFSSRPKWKTQQRMFSRVRSHAFQFNFTSRWGETCKFCFVEISLSKTLKFCWNSWDPLRRELLFCVKFFSKK